MVVLSPGPTPTEPFVRYINAELSAQVLGPILTPRLAEAPGSIVERTGNDISAHRYNVAFAAQDHRLMQNLLRLPHYNAGLHMSTTSFGRNFSAIQKLRENRYLPERPLRILQGGAGLETWEAIGLTIPRVPAIARSSGYEGRGVSYETGELAVMLANAGAVTLVDPDERIILAVDESLRLGMAIVGDQPFGTMGSKITEDDFAGNRTPPAYQAWIAYLQEFFAQTGNQYKLIHMDTPDGSITAGFAVAFEESVRKSVQAVCADIVTCELDETYDLAWLMNLFEYMSMPLWWTVLVRAISRLPIADGQNRYAGILVTNRFDRNPRMLGTPIRGRLGEFLTLAGMTLFENVISPLEHHGDKIIAGRTHKSEWLDEKVEMLRGSGI